MHMPPPVHGAAMVGQYIHDSKLINDKFDSHYINLTTAKNLQDIGKVGIRKLVDFIMLLRRILNSATLQFNILYKHLSNKKLPRILSCQKFHLS